MMGVYIKGMELPNEGVEWICFVRFTKRTAEFFDPTGESESVFYEAVEVPAHGRLVDADKLEEEIDFSLQQVNSYLDNLDADYYSAEYREMEARAECYRDALESIRDAPSVIPKEEP